MKRLLQRIYYIRSISKFKKVGRNLILSRGGTFIRPDEISIGDNVFINKNFHISARNLKFGNDIMIGPNLVIECDNHKYNHIGETMFQKRNDRVVSAVEIEDDVWVGANVIILPGVTIRKGSVIGAGSVVTKSTIPYSINVGNPCKMIKMRFSKVDLEEHKKKINKCNN